MARVRFLDGDHAASTTTVDDDDLRGEGRYMFQGRDIAPRSRIGTRYYLKHVARSQWADPSIAEWTAAVHDDPAEDD